MIDVKTIDCPWRRLVLYNIYVTVDTCESYGDARKDMGGCRSTAGISKLSAKKECFEKLQEEIDMGLGTCLLSPEPGWPSARCNRSDGVGVELGVVIA